METSEANAGLSFERANYTTSEAGTPCVNCNGPLGEQYWQWQSRAVCERCRNQLASVLSASQSKQAFGKAALLGGLTALGCGVAYGVFVALAHIQLALVTIGIAFVIAKVIRRCSAGIGGRKYQILAVVLTYLASAMGYAPGVLSAATHGPEARASASAADSASATEGAAHGHVSAGSLALSILLLFAFTLAAPVLAATEAPIGLLIIGFGLWEAWKLSRGVPISLNGPYRVTKTATGPPVA